MTDLTIKDYGTGNTPEEPTWTTEQLREEFIVVAFAAPHVVVRRKSDNKLGSLEFQHSPRIYWGWQEA